MIRDLEGADLPPALRPAPSAGDDNKGVIIGVSVAAAVLCAAFIGLSAAFFRYYRAKPKNTGLPIASIVTTMVTSSSASASKEGPEAAQAEPKADAV